MLTILLAWNFGECVELGEAQSPDNATTVRARCAAEAAWLWANQVSRRAVWAWTPARFVPIRVVQDPVKQSIELRPFNLVDIYIVEENAVFNTFTKGTQAR